MNKEVLILYYSKHGSTKQLAKLIARGVNSVSGVSAKIRTVPEVATVTKIQEPEIPLDGDVYATQEDLASCDGLALGSPVRFGNMASSLKYFIDGSVSVWAKGQLANKPACVFSASSSMHGGQETTLLSMMIPLFHHGMILLGLPFTESILSTTTTGGTPYGVTHYAGVDGDNSISADESSLAILQGKRLAEMVLKLTK